MKKQQIPNALYIKWIVNFFSDLNSESSSNATVSSAGKWSFSEIDLWMSRYVNWNYDLKLFWQFWGTLKQNFYIRAQNIKFFIYKIYIYSTLGLVPLFQELEDVVTRSFMLLCTFMFVYTLPKEGSSGLYGRKL